MKLRLGGTVRACGPNTLMGAATLGAAVALVSLLALDPAWAQSTTPQPRQATRTQTLKEDPSTARRRVERLRQQRAEARRKRLEAQRAVVREATDRAAQRLIKAWQELEPKLCKATEELENRVKNKTSEEPGNKTFEELRKAQAEFSDAERDLDRLIFIEASTSPEVRELLENRTKAQNAVLDKVGEERAAAELKAKEAGAAYEEALRQEQLRIRDRILGRTPIPDPTPPRRNSCGPDTGVRVALGGRSTTANVSTINAGTQISGGIESPVATSARRLTGGGAYAGFTVPVGRVADTVSFNFAFDQFNGSTFGSVAPGGASVAQTYIFPNPVSGSTGIAAGTSGQNVTTQTDGRLFDMAVVANGTFQPPALASPHSAAVVSYLWSVGGRYRNMRRTDSITQQSITFGSDLNSVIDLSATSNFFAPYFGAGVAVSPAGPSGLFGGLRAAVSPGMLWTSASATQISQCLVCGIASPERNVTLQRDLSTTQFSLITNVTAYAGYQFSPNAKLLLEASYENQTAAPVFFVPTSPTQQPIALNNASTDIFRVGGKVHVSLAPQ